MRVYELLRYAAGLISSRCLHIGWGRRPGLAESVLLATKSVILLPTAHH